MYPVPVCCYLFVHMQALPSALHVVWMYEELSAFICLQEQCAALINFSTLSVYSFSTCSLTSSFVLLWLRTFLRFCLLFWWMALIGNVCELFAFKLFIVFIKKVLPFGWRSSSLPWWRNNWWSTSDNQWASFSNQSVILSFWTSTDGHLLFTHMFCQTCRLH